MATWHPILNALESRVGTWTMIGPLEQPYAVITIVRRGDDLGYRATTFERDDNPTTVIGYYRTLMAASRGAHGWFTSTRGPSGRPAAGWLPAIPGDRS
jgi:hypothetical protein